eukprot:CAMPEP_0116140972 /NCGR_PEP_ID=MMETSP0329-20121206/14137_1 /TAXON_ID=697910 /ORGANISM="Pseudo-nitzschia arenysensis, Strain B593" /LENGTH=326 /DNA_ID=CAMNT_0003636131 /DNA_START=52 /DNA_END=1033 /DNA_ORIENTATION=-
MNTTNSMQRQFAIVALLAFVGLSACEAGIVTMGGQDACRRQGCPPYIRTCPKASVFRNARPPTTESSTPSLDEFIHDHGDHEGEHVDEEVEDAGMIDYEDVIIDVEEDQEEDTNHSQTVAEFVENQEGLLSNATIDIDMNETLADDDDSPFFSIQDLEEETEAPVVEAIEAEFASEARVEPTEEEIATIGRGIVVTGPRGGTADIAPGLQPTELSFMIVMDDFRYSDGVESLSDIQIGTKFGFTGRIVTQAENLGLASGSCTVTSDIKKELSYCDIFHRIDTDNFGGYGSVMVAGTADEIGGRFLVTGTGGSLQTTTQGYAMVQFD